MPNRLGREVGCNKMPLERWFNIRVVFDFISAFSSLIIVDKIVTQSNLLLIYLDIPF
jgi:hypothetical protein